MDYDPDGIAIMYTYEYGSIALAHEGDEITTPNIISIGLSSEHISDSDELQQQQQGLMQLTGRDRRKAQKMLDHNQLAQGEEEVSWRRELQVMMMLDMKAELQILDSSPIGLLGLLMARLPRMEMW